MRKSTKLIGKITIIIFLISLIINVIISFNTKELTTISEILINIVDTELSIIIPLGCLFFMILLADYFVYHNKLDKNDKMNKDYYRNILKGYSPLELSYIDNFKIDLPKDIVSVFLNLKLKGIIELDEKNIIIKDYKITLDEEEKYLLTKVIDGKITMVDEFELEKIVKDSCLNKKLIEYKDMKFSKPLFIIFIILFIIIFTIFLLFSFSVEDIDNTLAIPLASLIGILMVLIISIVPLFFFIYLFKRGLNPFFRSKKGEEVNIKLEGLKNYLKDFSLNSKRKIEEVVLWEDYLIYSVIFNQNKNLINDFYNKYFINNSVVRSEK